jgi:hypothetical protein
MNQGFAVEIDSKREEGEQSGMKVKSSAIK